MKSRHSFRDASLRASVFLFAAGLALATASTVQASGDSSREALLDGSDDHIVRSAFIPSDRNVHGEARLIRRGEAWVLQTILQSPKLRRGVQRMRKEELYAWPESEPGHEDSERYLVDLETAKDHAIAELEASQTSGGAPQMLIELILSPTDALWAFYEMETTHDGGELRILEKEPVAVREASRTYLRRAFVLQAESAFDGTVAELEELPR